MAENTVEIVFKGTTDDYKRALQEVAQLSKSGFNGVSKNAKKASDDAKRAWDPKRVLGVVEIEKEKAKLTAAYRQLKREGKVSATDIEKAFRKSTRALNDQNKTAKNLTRTVLRLGAAYISIRTITASIRALLRTGGDFERIRIQLEGLTGSAEAGEAAFEWVKDFVKDTPFGLAQVTQGFVKLKAFGLDPIDGTFQAIADQAALLGGSQETLNGIILGVGQAWAKARLQGEEILQLVERGVPVWELLQRATGKNVDELRKLSEQGKLGRETIRALIAEMGKASSGQALKQVKSFNGLVSNASDQWQQFLDTIAQSGALDFVSEELASLLDEVDRLAQTGELQQYAQGISDAFVSGVTVIKEVVGLIVELRGVIGLLLAGLVVKKIIAFAGGIKLLGDVSVAAALQTGKVSASLKGLLSVIRAGGYLIILDQLFTLYGLYRENLDIEKEATRFIDDQQRIIDKTDEASETQLRSIKALDNLTESEVRSYRKRLQASLAFYRAQNALLSRQNEQQNGLNAPASVEAREAARQAIIRSKALADLDRYVKDRLDREEEFRGKFEIAKNIETKILEDSINQQEKLLKDAEGKLKGALSRRDKLIKSFNDLIKDINAAPQKPDEDLTVLDPLGNIERAESQFDKGDIDGAIGSVERARDQIRALARDGKATDQYLTGLSQRALKIAQAAADADVASAEAEIKSAREILEQLTADAEGLKNIELGFDQEGAEQSFNEIQARIQEIANANPVIIPIQTAGGGAVPGVDIPARAHGGSLPGFSPGDRSDNILFMGTAGEHVIQRPAVRHYGRAFVEAINQMKIPRYATGGEIMSQVSSISTAGSSSNAGIQGTPVILQLDGQSFNTFGSSDTVDGLKRALSRQAMKTGSAR